MVSTNHAVLTASVASLVAFLHGCASDSKDGTQSALDPSTTIAPTVSPGAPASGASGTQPTTGSVQPMTTAPTQVQPSMGGTGSGGADATSPGGTNSDGTNTSTSAPGATGPGSDTGDTSGNGTQNAGGADAGSRGGDAATGGPEGSTSDQTDDGGQGGDQSDGTDSGSLSGCVGNPWPSANPTSAGPFQVAADKDVGPLAGVVPDPIYGEQQQRYNVYRPANLEQSEYCHPILIWANGYRDNPEQKSPDCIVDSAANRWCGQYLPLMNHLASHGFVVVASLSTATAEGDPLPTIAGLDWILEQAEDPSSQYYQRLDTNNIGQLGHSYGGMSTCMSASEPRYKALATICGTRELNGVHTPMLFFCGGQDTTVNCEGVRNTFLTVTDQPAFFINELNADHGSWVYQGPDGVSLSSSAAWFRAHLMGDAESRKYFYGANCTFCSDNRVQAEQNSLMAQ